MNTEDFVLLSHRIARQQATIETLLSALEDAYRHISAPVLMTQDRASYRLHNYNELTAKMRAAINIARAK